MAHTLHEDIVDVNLMSPDLTLQTKSIMYVSSSEHVMST